MEKDGPELLKDIVKKELSNYIESCKFFEQKYSDSNIPYSLEFLDDTLEILIKTVEASLFTRVMQAFDMSYLSLEIDLSEKANTLKKKIYQLAELQEGLQIAEKMRAKRFEKYSRRLETYAKKLENHIEFLKKN